MMSYYRLKIRLWAILSSLLPMAAMGSPSTAPFIPMAKAPVIYQKGQHLYDQFPWAATYYYGITCTDPVMRIFRGQFHRWPEHIQSIEFAHTLSEKNFFRSLLSPLVGVVQLAADFTLRTGSNENTIYEFDPYIAFRWANFPWNNYVNTSFALGEGISYDTSVPSIEKRYSNNTKRLLNFALAEFTFASPNYPRLQLIARLHHRSGAYGLYHAGNSGSNDVGLGIRYLFD